MEYIPYPRVPAIGPSNNDKSEWIPRVQKYAGLPLVEPERALGATIGALRRKLLMKWPPIDGSLWQSQPYDMPVRDPKELHPGAWLTCTKPYSGNRQQEAENLGIESWTTGLKSEQVARAWVRKLYVPARSSEEHPVLYPAGSGYVAPPLRECQMWWMELFVPTGPKMSAQSFVRCLRTRLLHVVNRDCPRPSPLKVIEARKLGQGTVDFVLPVLSELPQPTSLLWLVSAARQVGETQPNSRKP